MKWRVLIPFWVTERDLWMTEPSTAPLEVRAVCEIQVLNMQTAVWIDTW